LNETLYVAAGCSSRGLIIFGVFTDRDGAIAAVRGKIQKEMKAHPFSEEDVEKDPELHQPAHYAFRVYDDMGYEVCYITVLLATPDVLLV